MGTVRVLCWRSLAMLFVLLGMIGVVVPGMPTVVFLLLAAWAGSHGWPQLERWLLQHPRHGGISVNGANTVPFPAARSVQRPP